MDLNDIGSERAVISGLMQYGIDSWVDVADLIVIDCFTSTDNQLIFTTFKKLFEKGVRNIDYPTFCTQAKELGYFEVICQSKTSIEYLSSLKKLSIHKENVRKHALKIMNLYVARKAQEKHKEAYENLKSITGTEGLDHVLSISEAPIINFAHELNVGNDDRPQLIGDQVEEYLHELGSNPVDNIGIPTPWPVFNNCIGGGLRTGVTLLAARPKALVYGSFVYTSNGPVKIEDIKIGDKVLNPDSTESTVEETYDFENEDIYRVSLKDGDYIDCCKDHLWEVFRTIDNKKFVLSTSEIIKKLHYGSKNKRNKWKIRLPKPLKFNESKVDIDPYILGIILGNGSVSNNTLTYHTMDEEIHNAMFKYFNKLGLEVKFESKRSKATSWRVNGFQDVLRKVGIFGHNCYNKFIPKQYKYNSVKIRKMILAGLLDTDGDCTFNNSGKTRVRYTSVSYQLCSDVKEIVESLGGICSIKENYTTCLGKKFKSYRCEIRLQFNPFKLKRKKERFNNNNYTHRFIKDIKYIGKNNARCIKVSNNNGLFLTNNCIITHNCGKTTIAKSCAIHVAKKGIPVLMLDTEMNKTDQVNRSLAEMADIQINDIETGKFINSDRKTTLLFKAAEELKKLRYYHKRIGGKDFDEVLSIIRRWIYTEVGFDKNGKPNPHVVMYDYFKLMSSDSLKSMQEYQAIGFQISKMTDFCNDHSTPVLAFVQINRDGLTKDTSDVISQSDRLLWLCISASLYKRKTAEEIASDGPENGNMKLVPLEARYGKVLDEGDWINLYMDGSKSIIKELNTRKSSIKRKSNDGFERKTEQDEDTLQEYEQQSYGEEN